MNLKITRRYLAGLIDGEGYISIRPDKYWSRSHYKPVIKMALCEKSAYLIYAIKEKLGGHVHIRRFNNGRFNNAYCWEVQTFDAVEKVLSYIRPYLILKKEQADIVNELIKTKSKTISVDGTFTKISPQVLAKRQRLYNLVKALNKRGCAPAETKQEPPVKQDDVIVRSSGQPEEVNRNINPA